MLLQTDGSRHDWLEGQAPYLTLIGYVDDATGELLGAVFREQEDAAGYFLGLRSICQRQGIPAAIYADRHTIFQAQPRPRSSRNWPTSNPKPVWQAGGRIGDRIDRSSQSSSQGSCGTAVGHTPGPPGQSPTQSRSMQPRTSQPGADPLHTQIQPALPSGTGAA